MDYVNLKASITSYEAQLSQIELAISASDGSDRDNLISLRDDIKQLIDLTRENLNLLNNDTGPTTSNQQSDHLNDEYATFMAEMVKEGAVEKQSKQSVNDELQSLEGMKCKAPHKHQWGDTMYHNAIICSVMTPDEQNFEEIQLKVLFTNPTHQEMLPCPYYLDTECKFTDEKCRYSHGEIVSFSSLQEYVEPEFKSLAVGSKVLAKQNDKLWYRATVKQIFNCKCVVQFESNQKSIELDLQDVFPLCTESEGDETGSEHESDNEDVINMSLINTPVSEALGNWEKYTTGIGSKLMEKMGYVLGTGLGRRSDGILEPISAVILPPGKSLDHCMKLRERAGDDKNLFSAERKLKRLQKKQEVKNKKMYERTKNKTDMFNFLNNTLSHNSVKQNQSMKSNHRQDIKKESLKNLNVASLKIDEDIKRIERDLYKIRESLSRHKDVDSQVHRNLKMKLNVGQGELKSLQDQALNIKNEQNLRSDKKKMTVF